MRKHFEDEAHAALVSARVRRELEKVLERRLPDDVFTTNGYGDVEAYDAYARGEILLLEAIDRIANRMADDRGGYYYEKYLKWATDQWYGGITGLGLDMDAVVSYSPSLVQWIHDIQAAGWTLEPVEGNAFDVDEQQKKIYLAISEPYPVERRVFLLARAVARAMLEHYPIPWQSPDVGMTEEEWLEREMGRYFRTEAEASLIALRVQREIVYSSGIDITDFPDEGYFAVPGTYGEADAYDAYVADELPVDEAVGVDEVLRDEALARIVEDMQSGPSTAEHEGMREFLKTYWDSEFADSQPAGGNSVSSSDDEPPSADATAAGAAAPMVRSPGLLLWVAWPPSGANRVENSSATSGRAMCGCRTTIRSCSH